MGITFLIKALPEIPCGQFNSAPWPILLRLSVLSGYSFELLDNQFPS
jgi:hypothetical protein